MAISWFPGHMNKGRKELRRLFGRLDAVIELLDARAPAATSNPDFVDLIGDLPALSVLTKTDLADPATSALWLDSLAAPKRHAALASSLEQPLSRAQIITRLAPLLPPETASPSSPGRLAIIGIPNVGKSTLLNQLAGRKLARTGNEPAVTRAQQQVRLDEAWLLVDTPGLLWPKLTDQRGAYFLAMLGSIRQTALDVEDVAWFAAEYLAEHYPEALEARYDAAVGDTDPERILTAVAHSRGALGRGGAVDFYRAGELLLNDFRSGKLGRISLESPSSGNRD